MDSTSHPSKEHGLRYTVLSRGVQQQLLHHQAQQQQLQSQLSQQQQQQHQPQNNCQQTPSILQQQQHPNSTSIHPNSVYNGPTVVELDGNTMSRDYNTGNRPIAIPIPPSSPKPLNIHDKYAKELEDLTTIIQESIKHLNMVTRYYNDKCDRKDFKSHESRFGPRNNCFHVSLIGPDFNCTCDLGPTRLALIKVNSYCKMEPVSLTIDGKGHVKKIMGTLIVPYKGLAKLKLIFDKNCSFGVHDCDSSCKVTALFNIMEQIFKGLKSHIYYAHPGSVIRINEKLSDLYSHGRDIINKKMETFHTTSQQPLQRQLSEPPSPSPPAQAVPASPDMPSTGESEVQNSSSAVVRVINGGGSVVPFSIPADIRSCLIPIQLSESDQLQVRQRMTALIPTFQKLRCMAGLLISYKGVTEYQNVQKLAIIEQILGFQYAKLQEDVYLLYPSNLEMLQQNLRKYELHVIEVVRAAQQAGVQQNGVN
ncbi:hypothetical protein HDU76_005070 [Blyttiomyces sp. JEL0837]|nr:hypothetical protein HDU76_005070 [Blyttiomyces sp. JEL0837]